MLADWGRPRRVGRSKVTDAAFPYNPPVFYTTTFANCRPAKRRDEPGDAQLLQDFQRHVQRWPGPVWRAQLAGVKPGLREPARNASTPLNQSLVDAWPRRQ